jgi:hypothetical protein
MLRVVPVGAAAGLLGGPRALCEPAAAHSLVNKMRYLGISSKATYHGSSADAIPPYSHCLVHSVCVANAVGALLDIFRPGCIQLSHELPDAFYDSKWTLWSKLRMLTVSNKPSPPDLPGWDRSPPPLRITAPSFSVQINQMVYDNTATEYYFAVTAQSTGVGWLGAAPGTDTSTSVTSLSIPGRIRIARSHSSFHRTTVDCSALLSFLESLDCHTQTQRHSAAAAAAFPANAGRVLEPAARDHR